MRCAMPVHATPSQHQLSRRHYSRLGAEGGAGKISGYDKPADRRSRSGIWGHPLARASRIPQETVAGGDEPAPAGGAGNHDGLRRWYRGAATAGTYTVTVTATDSSNTAITTSANFTVTIQ
jgi:hypothetical protein